MSHAKSIPLDKAAQLAALLIAIPAWYDKHDKETEMTIDNSGNTIVTPEARAVYDEHDKNIDSYVEAVLACLRELPTPKPHTLPPGTDRMRYSPIERAFMTATHSLYRDFQRWKETRG